MLHVIRSIRFGGSLYGGELVSKKVHLLSWDRICQPKKNRGLGIRTAMSYNNAFIMKLAWNVFINSGALWVEVLKNKNNVSNRVYMMEGVTNGSSYLWKAMQRQVIFLNKGVSWAIGNGKKARFWLDPWIGNGCRLIDVIVAEVPNMDVRKLVYEYVDVQGQWAWHLFSQYLPSSIILNIASIKPPIDRDEEDVMY